MMLWAEASLDFGSPDLRDLGRVAVTAASYYMDFTPTFCVSQLKDVESAVSPKIAFREVGESWS